jgi:2,4-dienoyl-CoA reductase-like NADH-dependent reductase (Old Yellow Enzyme family)
VLDEVDPSRVGMKISPMHEGGPMAAHDETLPMAEYAVRELSGYGLSHLLLMGNTTDFTGTPLEPLIGDGMFRHFRPRHAGRQRQYDRRASNRLIADGLADMVAFGRPYIANPTWWSGSRPVPRSPKSIGKPSTPRDRTAIPTTRRSATRPLNSSETGKLAEHWDVLQDEATQAESVSGLPMFGDRFPA